MKKKIGNLASIDKSVLIRDIYKLMNEFLGDIYKENRKILRNCKKIGYVPILKDGSIEEFVRWLATKYRKVLV